MSVISDPARFRKTVAGVCLIGFPLAAFISCFTDSTDGTGDPGTTLYATVANDASGIHTTGLIFMLSALITVPAALGVAHLLRQRAGALGNIGATLLVLGAFGHFGFGFWQVIISQAVTPGEPAGVTAYLGRISTVSTYLLPLLIFVDLGVLLLSIGLVRARSVPVWAPWVTIGAVAVDFVVQLAGVSATWPITAIWGLLTVTWGFVGLRILAMSPDAWASFSAVRQVPATAVPVSVAA